MQVFTFAHFRKTNFIGVFFQQNQKILYTPFSRYLQNVICALYPYDGRIAVAFPLRHNNLI